MTQTTNVRPNNTDICLELIFDLISKTLVDVIFVWRHWTAFIFLMNVHLRLWPLGTKIRIIRYCDVPVGKEHKKTCLRI